MKSYKTVIRYRGTRYGPFATIAGPDSHCLGPSYVYKRPWFPRNGEPGPWLPKTAPVVFCRVGWHFARGREQLRETPAAYFISYPDSPDWIVYLRGQPSHTFCKSVIADIEVWEIRFRHATHWADNSAARTIRFVRKLSREEAVALMEGT